MKNFSFQSSGIKLDGTIFYPPNKKEKYPAILFVHGWTANRKRGFQYAKSLSKLGFICMLFDIRGHGTSEGDIKTFTIKEFFDDVLAAYDYLAKIKDVDLNNISAVGSSFGSYLISLLSEKRKIKNLVLRVPADYPSEIFNKRKKSFSSHDQYIMDWRKQEKDYKETYALKALHNFSGSVLVIEAEKDESIPRQTIENYLNSVKDKNKLTYILLKGAPHSVKAGKFRDQIEQILVKWFNTQQKIREK